MISRLNIDHFEHKNVIILALINMSKFCLLWTKNKINFYVRMKINDFILQEQKLKLTIEIGNENIFYI
jgi:hypothetical protein